MEIEIRSSGVDLMEALRAYLQRRMRFRFDRHPEVIRKITVRLTEQSGAKADGRTNCHITAELIPSGEIFVSEGAADLYRAIGGGIERLGAALHGIRGRQRTGEGFESIRKEQRASLNRGVRCNAKARRPRSQRGRVGLPDRLRS